MNIFYLSTDPVHAADLHVDKHVCKMIVEYAQLLSGAHRFVDGYPIEDVSGPRKKILWKLNDPILDENLYKATHLNHPCAIWARYNDRTYYWLFQLFCALCIEYTFRYGKIHKTESLVQYLRNAPKNIAIQNSSKQFIEPPLAMPEKYHQEDRVKAYRDYYNQDKRHLHAWKRRTYAPFWISNNGEET